MAKKDAAGGATATAAQTAKAKTKGKPAQETPEQFDAEMAKADAAGNGAGAGDAAPPAGETEFKKQTHDAKGQGFIPGAEPLVIPELNAAATAYDTTKRARMKLTAQEVEDKAELARVAQKHRQHFAKDEITGNLIYSAGGVTVTITHEEKETVNAKIETVSAVVGEY